MNTAPTWVNIVGTVMIWICAALATGFVVLYHLTAPWRSTPEGRHMMSFMAVIAAVLDLLIVRYIFGDSTWFQILRLLVFTGVPLVLGWRLWILIRLQVIPRHRYLRAKRRVTSGSNERSVSAQTPRDPK